jgi:osmoprotectant transport system ATP-binding protein
VARALAADPPVLLMDEPFSAVDPIVRSSLQDELIRLQAGLSKTVVLVTHDVEEAIKVGDLVAVYRPDGHLAQVDGPERLLAFPADDYVEGFIGFDRGIRRLSFFPADRLDLSLEAVLGSQATVAEALQVAKSVGQPWVLVIDSERKPLGWAATAQFELLPRERALSSVPLTGYGHTFRPGADSLRAALDATVLSRTGHAIGVDEQGRVLGVASFDQLGTAIHAADEAATEDAAGETKA